MTDLDKLIIATQEHTEALKGQTAAINRLIEINVMLLDVVLQDSDVEAPEGTYLDGSKG